MLDRLNIFFSRACPCGIQKCSDEELVSIMMSIAAEKKLRDDNDWAKDVLETYSLMGDSRADFVGDYQEKDHSKDDLKAFRSALVLTSTLAWMFGNTLELKAPYLPSSSIEKILHYASEQHASTCPIWKDIIKVANEHT